MRAEMINVDMDKRTKPVEIRSLSEKVGRRLLTISAALVRAIGDPDQLWKTMK